MAFNVLLLGSGGREHALAWGISKSNLLDALYIAPGNPGTAELGENVELSLSDFEAIAEFVDENDIDLTVVGPEKPLVGGITDFLEERGHKVFGPSKVAAQLEGSKSFAKEFMLKHGIPTASYVTFDHDEFDKAATHIERQNEYPVVLKADGLAGGKGVFICDSEKEVFERLELLHEDAKLSKAASSLVVEDYMEGEEASVFVISDGKTAKIIHNAQDHKRIGEGDTGLNTGGMGAYCPAPVMTDQMLKRVEREIIMPTISGMLLDENPYKGILYLGLMITQDGPKVVEYNCRFGDPECQPIVPSLKTDLLDLMMATVKGELDSRDIELDERYRCCVVMASKGYPKEYEKGKVITGFDDLEEEAIVFHSGTAMKDGELVTDGGRVLSVVCPGETLMEAIKATYRQIEKISFDKAYYRSDIGKKGLKHLI